MPPRRTFEEIRNILLVELSKGRKTINALSKEAGVNWSTTENHITYLIGKGMISEVFNSPYVRIYEITEKGKQYVDQINPKGILKFIKEDKKRGIPSL